MLGAVAMERKKQTPPADTAFASWVKHQLNLRRMSQVQFAVEGGLSTPQVSQFLRGTRGAGVETYKAVAKAFDMPLVDVLKQAGVEVETAGEYSPEDEYILSLLHGLTPEQKVKCVEFIEFQARRTK